MLQISSSTAGKWCSMSGGPDDSTSDDIGFSEMVLKFAEKVYISAVL